MLECLRPGVWIGLVSLFVVAMLAACDDQSTPETMEHLSSTPVSTSVATSTPSTATPTLEPTGPVPMEHLSSTPVSTSVATSTPSRAAPTLEPTSPVPVGFGPGTNQVGKDIQPGVYAGRAGDGTLDGCSWRRLSGVSGEISDIIAIDNARGQFYVEILDTDKYFRTSCVVTPLEAWPTPAEPLSKIEIGTHMIGRDISPGIYAGRAGDGTLDGCSWRRLSGVSGEISDIVAIDNARGQFYVEILDTDKYFRTACVVTPLEAWPTPAEPLSKIEIGAHMIGRDISPGIYAGRAGDGTLDGCSWRRLSGVSGEISDIIAIDNTRGQFYVEILDTDKYFRTGCMLELVE